MEAELDKIPEQYREPVSRILNALREGKRVFVSGREVKEAKVVFTGRTWQIVFDGQPMYLSQLIKRRIVIL